MNKRNVLILCLLAVLCCTLMLPTGAEVILDNAGHGMTGTTTVRLVITGTYTVTIPAELPIVYGAESTTMRIEASNVAVGSKQAVEVAVEDAAGELAQTGGPGTIPYKLLCDGEAFTRAVFAQTGAVQVDVAISLEDWFSAAAGEYTDTVTFRVGLTEQEVAQ